MDTSALLQPRKLIITPYIGPCGGHVRLGVSSELPVRAAILDGEKSELVFAGPNRYLSFGTVVRPTVRWYVQIENHGHQATNVTWSVKELIL